MEIVEFWKYPLFLEGERIDGEGGREYGVGNVGRENQQAGKKWKFIPVILRIISYREIWDERVWKDLGKRFGDSFGAREIVIDEIRVVSLAFHVVNYIVPSLNWYYMNRTLNLENKSSFDHIMTWNGWGCGVD